MSGLPGTPARVLVVDDDPDINRLLRVRLATRGYEVDAAFNGDEALVRLDQAPPDLLFLDVAMPGVDGLQVLGHVRGKALDIAVIMMTAFGSEQVAIEALRRGADDYLRKPFEPQEFTAVLERTHERLALRRQNAVLRRQLEAELARAAEVQADLLPRDVPHLPGFELAARCIPAREVGGDFYDWQETAPGVLTLSVGDVMGKGIPAALLMATIRATLRAVTQHADPAPALALAQRALEPDLERAGSFMTIFHAQLDVTARRLTYADAGHGYVFVRRASGALERLGARGLPLGVMSTVDYRQDTLTLDAGDAVVIYSDGLTEACPDLLADHAGVARHLDGATTAAEMVHRLIAQATLHGSPPDDLTAVVLLCCEG